MKQHSLSSLTFEVVKSAQSQDAAENVGVIYLDFGRFVFVRVKSLSDLLRLLTNEVKTVLLVSVVGQVLVLKVLQIFNRIKIFELYGTTENKLVFEIILTQGIELKGILTRFAKILVRIVDDLCDQNVVI